jgi:hypothetical protein
MLFAAFQSDYGSAGKDVTRLNRSFRTAGGDGRTVEIFVSYLSEIPLKAWVEAARRRLLTRRMAEAELALHTLERQSDDSSRLFAVKDAVLNALQRFECAEGRYLTRQRSVTDHLRLATEHAALAILLRNRLQAEDFATLYAPFEPAIPSTLLFGLPIESEERS